MMKREFTGYVPTFKELRETDTANATMEDSGSAIIVEVDEVEGKRETDAGMWVRLQSWDPSRRHLELAHFAGKKVKVTVEVIE